VKATLVRSRSFRVVRVQLECGCEKDLHTSRWRVTRGVAACIFGDAVRRGVWCSTHHAWCQATELLGVARAA
jgi:hypothetical protein